MPNKEYNEVSFEDIGDNELLILKKQRVSCVQLPDDILDILPDPITISLYCLLDRYENQSINEEFLSKRLNVSIDDIYKGMQKLFDLKVVCLENLDKKEIN